jgi:hypothetical protein
VLRGAGDGDAFGDDVVEGGEEFGWGVGSVGGREWPQDAVVDLGVEVGEEQAVAGQDVLVAAGTRSISPLRASRDRS